MKTVSYGVTATCAVAALTLAFSPAADAAAVTNPGPAAANFLAGQLSAGNGRIQTVFDGTAYDDLGLTIDSILALDAAKAGQTQAAAATKYIVANASSYISYGADYYAGATGKLLVLAAAQGLNSHSVSGIDLVTRLQGMQATSGRFKDKVAAGETDYSNMVGQSLAVIGLKRAGASVATSAAYITTQQCADGGFSSELDASKCASDPDATGFAVQALMAAGGHGAAVTKGVNYLKTHQNSAGAVPSVSGVANTNTTGLAGAVFAAAGDSAAAAKAASFVKSLQYDCAMPKALAGGVAFSATDFAARKAAGAKAVVADSDVRATPQALLAISGVNYATATAGGSAGTTAASCATSTSTSTSTGTSTATRVTGPPVVTDGPASVDDNASTLAVGGALAGLATVGFAGAVVRTRRRR